MEISKPLQNLITQARTVSKAGTNRYYRLSATLITPTQHIPVYLISHFDRTAMFASSRADDYRLTCQIQPGLYLKQVLPFSDNLKLEVIEREGLKQTSRMFRCIPLTNNDPEMSGNNTKVSNLENFDSLNIITVNLQLQELGFAILRNSFTTDSVFFLARTDKALQHALITDGAEVGLSGADAFRGVDMPIEGDNAKVYKHIEIPDGTRLMDLPTYLQNDDKYGIYSAGLACFYRKGMFYLFPPFLMGRYKTAARVLDIFRFPEDATPTLETTWYTNNKTVTILSTGHSKHQSTVDITRQNNGVGKRIINPDALSGKAGNFYAKGKAITTRSDSMSEYQTAQRGSGEQISVYDRNPAENIYKGLSETAYNDGELITIPWDQSNAELITPGMPCKYYFTQANDVLVEVEGVVLGVISQSVQNDTQPNTVFRERSTLFVFLVYEGLDT